VQARPSAELSASATKRDGAGVFTAEGDNQVDVEEDWKID
jgi:hypothetical protein